MATSNMSDWVNRKLLEIMEKTMDWDSLDLVGVDYYRRHLVNLPKQERDNLYRQVRPEDLPDDKKSD